MEKKMTVFLFTSFFSLFSCIYAQNKISGIVINEDDDALAGVTLLLYTANDTTNFIKASQSDVNGDFVFENVDRGNYRLEFRMIGMASLTILFPVEIPQFDIGSVVMSVDEDNILEEVAVEGKMQEYSIWLETLGSKFEHIITANPPKRNTNNSYRFEQDFKDYVGQWQWCSADGDSIFTILLTDEYVPYHGKIYNSESRITDIKNTRISYHINRVFGKYEYRIRDSIIFSNIDDKVNFRNKKVNRRPYLVGVLPQSSPEEKLEFFLSEIPQTKKRAFVSFSLIDKNTVLFRLDVVKDRDKESVTVRRAVKGDFILPVNVVLNKIANRLPQK